MGSPIFDWLIQREHVQLLLAVFAAVWVVGVYLLYGRSQNQSKKPARQKNFWLLLGALGPLALALWFVYNAIMDAFGLDSVRALIINLAIFLVVGVCVGMLFRSTIKPPKPPAEPLDDTPAGQ